MNTFCLYDPLNLIAAKLIHGMIILLEKLVPHQPEYLTDRLVQPAWVKVKRILYFLSFLAIFIKMNQ